MLQYFIADYLQIEMQCKDNCEILLSVEKLWIRCFILSHFFSQTKSYIFSLAYFFLPIIFFYLYIFQFYLCIFINLSHFYTKSLWSQIFQITSVQDGVFKFSSLPWDLLNIWVMNIVVFIWLCLEALTLIIWFVPGK